MNSDGSFCPEAFWKEGTREKRKERKGKKDEYSMNTRPRVPPSLVSSIESRAMGLITGIHRVGPGRQNFRAINYSKVCWPILGIAVQIFASIWECICVDGVRLSGWYSMKITFSSLDLLLIGSIDGTVELVLL